MELLPPDMTLDQYADEFYYNGGEPKETDMNNEQQDLVLSGNYVDDCFRVGRFLFSRADKAFALERAFFDTGNDKMADKMFNLGNDLEMCAKSIRDICSNKTSADLAEATKQTGELMMKMLAKADKGINV